MSVLFGSSAIGLRRRLHATAALCTLASLLLIVPLGIRVLNAWHAGPELPPSYLPALEGPRARQAAFEATRISDLQRLNPGYVVIGDSMAGTRIDERRLGELAGSPVAPLLQAGSGSAFWYLALKNWVIASGIKPRVVFIFFRDTNLTDVMFRLDEQFRWSLDLVAGQREDDLNSAIAARTDRPYYRIHSLLDRVYQADRARTWIEPAITNWPAQTIIPSRRRRDEFRTTLNARFGLDHLRPMEAADMQAVEDRLADFFRYVDESVLPLMLRDANAAGLKLCFVRVQRRPVGGRPPEQSPALQRYVSELGTYLMRNGAEFRDDTGDPELTLDMYEDGDHIARHARTRYTELFFERLSHLFVNRTGPEGASR
jgi:hypothetical protein